MIPDGDRNDTLFRYASKQRGRGLGEHEILVLLEAANKRCKPPLPARDLVTIARSASKYEPNTKPEATETQAAPAALRILRLSNVNTTRVKWLWESRLPHGKLVICDGVPGLGKSTMLTDLAARITTGRAMPDLDDVALPSQPRGVILLSAEDGYSDTIRPRFDAANGDTTRLVIVDEAPDAKGRYRPPVIPDDLDLLEQLIKDEDAALLIIDPLMAFLSSETDSYRDQDVRRVLAVARVKTAAERSGACVVCVRHPTKSGSLGGHAQYAGGGSVGIIGAARVGLYIGEDPNDTNRRILAVAKSNIGRIPPSLIYTLEAVDPLGVAHVAWHGESPLTADQIHAPAAGRTTKRDEVKVEALEYLHEIKPNRAGLRGIARELELEDRRTLRRALADLVDEGDIGKDDHDQYGIAEGGCTRNT